MLLASEQEFRFILPAKQEGTTVVGFFQTDSLKIDVFDILIRPKDTLLFWIDSHHGKVHTMKIATPHTEATAVKVKRDLKELKAFDVSLVVYVNNISNIKFIFNRFQPWMIPNHWP